MAAKKKSSVKSRVPAKSKKLNKKSQFKLWMGLVIVLIISVVGLVVLRYSQASKMGGDPSTFAAQNEEGLKRLQLDREYYAKKGSATAAANIPKKLTTKEVEELTSPSSSNGNQSLNVGNPTQKDQVLPKQNNGNQKVDVPPVPQKPPGYPNLPTSSTSSDSYSFLRPPTAQAYGYYNGASVWWANNSYAQQRYYFGFPSVEWCNWFIMWVASKAGKSIAPYPWTYSGQTASLMAYYGRLRSPSSWSPQQGDLVWFSFNNYDGVPFDHIAIVTRVDYDKSGCSIVVMNGNWGNHRDTSVVAPARYACNDWRIITYADWFGY